MGNFDGLVHQEEDWILLEAEFPQALTYIPLPRVEIAPFTPLLLYSHQTVLLLAQELRRELDGHDGEDLFVTGNWVNLVRVDTAPTCLAVAVKSPCIAHGCQTQGGVSGAGLFARDPATGKLGLAVIHTLHRLRKPRGTCDQAGFGNAPNSGLVAPLMPTVDIVASLGVDGL